MKAKRTAPQRRRISFAVDRDEIEVNSDWVEAVMASPTRPAAPPVQSSSTAVLATVQQQQIFSERGVLEDAFFAADTKSATGEESAPGAECSSVEIGASVAQNSSVEINTTVE
jgi:hypothetical protein